MQSSTPYTKGESCGMIIDNEDVYSTGEEVCSFFSEKKVTLKKYELVDYNSLPDYLKHNEFILSYYRSDWPWRETILSIFSIHNETINVWTHLIGFLLFLILTVGAATMLPRNEGMVQQQQMNGQHVNVTGTALIGGNLHELNGRSNNSSRDSGAPIPTWEVNNRTSPPPLKALGDGNNINTTTTTTNTTSMVDHDKNNNNYKKTKKPITRWPFMAFMVGAMLCLLSSSACHLLSCHSEHCCYAMLRIDYAGISMLIVTSFYPLAYYAFLCHPFFQSLYISSITIFGLATMLISLVPVFETPDFRVVRVTLFCCMAISGFVPILHKLALYGDRKEALLATAYEAAMAIFYGIGAVIYVARVPERWFPGKFDITGHSHQLFHVLVVAGAYMHYNAGLVYLQWRDSDSC